MEHSSLWPFGIQINRRQREDEPKFSSLDLIFREPDGWVVVYHRTDEVDEILDAMPAHYKPQVETYLHFSEEISQEKLKEAGPYFLDGSRWIIV